MKKIITVSLLFILSFGIIQAQNIPTTPYTSRGEDRVNNLNNAIGKTSYQIDRSIYTYKVLSNNTYVNAYYYYIWFYNESTYFNGYEWRKASTYIQSINVYSDNIFIGNYYLLITGDYQYITIWSTSPNSRMTLIISNPIPYY